MFIYLHHMVHDHALSFFQQCLSHPGSSAPDLVDPGSAWGGRKSWYCCIKGLADWNPRHLHWVPNYRANQTYSLFPSAGDTRKEEHELVEEYQRPPEQLETIWSGHVVLSPSRWGGIHWKWTSVGGVFHYTRAVSSFSLLIKCYKCALV